MGAKKTGLTKTGFNIQIIGAAMEAALYWEGLPID